jgi:cellulose synthase/poly-beta-1,6-N-acetylglucosamine synthase-like glycosyltransferase|tara:strand:+ start:99 stop:884 length:786 start_codon:yes stop_codon:yes gene_type:complete
MVDTTVICSLFIAKRDYTRIQKTLDWYHNIAKTAGRNFKLWLINDASEEDISDILSVLTPENFCKQIIFFNSDVREGKAKKLNKLLRGVDTPFVAVVDNDVLLPETWLTGCVVVCQFPKVSVCGVLVEDWIPKGRVIKHLGVPFYNPQCLGGACMVWKKEKLGALGFFNEKFGLYGNEDNEFLTRVSAYIGLVCAIIKDGTHMTDPTDNKEYIKWKRKMHKKFEPQAVEVCMSMKADAKDGGRHANPKYGTWERKWVDTPT